MNVIQFGARQAVCNCVKVKAGERVVITTDHQTERLADAIKAEAEQVGATVQKFIMEDFGPRPEDGKNPLPFPKQIDDALKTAQWHYRMASEQYPGASAKWAQYATDRLKALGRLDVLNEIAGPRDWSKTHSGGPRKLSREDVALE